MGESVANIDAVTDFVFNVPVLFTGAPPGCGEGDDLSLPIIVLLSSLSHLKNALQFV